MEDKVCNTNYNWKIRKLLYIKKKKYTQTHTHKINPQRNAEEKLVNTLFTF